MDGGAQSHCTQLLVLNCGSSSLKWSVINTVSEATLGSGTLETSSITAAALPQLLENAPNFDSIAHRIVHGGSSFTHAARVDPRVRATLQELTSLAPLHMLPALDVLDACAAAFPNTPQYAAFDTAFHRSIPESRRQYALPLEWRQRWQLQRFGFHGLSVEYCVSRLRELLGALPARLLVCHLGSGCSITAVKDGKSFDTTMGFTPLEGPLMATRSGSIDPGLLVHLLQQGLSVAELANGLLHRSGIAGLACNDGDLREVLAGVDSGSTIARLAYETFTVSLQRSVGAMLASMNGVDALVFTGGMGENSARLRADIVAGLAFADIALDVVANAEARAAVAASAEANGGVGGDIRISTLTSRVSVFRIHTREDLAILRNTVGSPEVAWKQALLTEGGP